MDLGILSEGIKSKMPWDTTYTWNFKNMKMCEQRVVATGVATDLWAECGGPSPTALGAAEASVLLHAETHSSQPNQGHLLSTFMCSEPSGPSLEGHASSL